MQSDSYAVSAHEAGHALTAYLCGGSAWIERKGQCGASVPDGSDDARWVTYHMLIDASGLAAESLLCPDPQAQLAAAGDREEFALGCKALRALGSPFVGASDDLTWDLYVQAAKALLANHDHILADLASQVERHGRLDKGGVEGRIAWWGIRPIFSEADWREVLVDLLQDGLEALEDSAAVQALARRWA